MIDMFRMLRVFIFFAAVCVFVAVSAKEITISITDAPADSVFAEIMHISGKNFVYNPRLLADKRFTIHATEMTLPDILSELFDKSDVGYKINGNNIILFKRKHEIEYVTISGFVREGVGGESLIGAVVYDLNSKRGTQTNVSGFYTLTIPKGDVRIRVSYPGFTPIESENIPATINRNIDFTMTEIHSIAEVDVIGDKNKLIVFDSAESGRLNLTNIAIKSTPTLFGEADVIKTLQLQPGVSAGIEGFAGLYVHGGNNDENLYMLDNVPLYQINHFGGLFSAFNTSAIKNVDFYKTSFPVKYDGRLSSIMEVNTLDGSTTNHSGSLSLGLTSAAFNINGPIVKNSTAYSFALRRSWFDILTIPALAIYNRVREDKENTTIFQYAFTDLNAKITHQFQPGNSAHLMFYYGNDYLKGGYKEDLSINTDEEKSYESSLSRLSWGNIVASVGWNYNFSDKLFGEFTGAYTRYKSKLNNEYVEFQSSYNEVIDDFNKQYTTENGISDWILRADMEYHPKAGHKISFGSNYIYHSFLPQKKYGSMSSLSQKVSINDAYQKLYAHQAALYAGYDWEVTKQIRLNAGIHMGVFSTSGSVKFNPNPRLSVRWRTSDKLSLKVAYARMSQYISQLTESSISLPTDQWIPISANMKPQISDKVAVSANYDIKGKYTVSIDAYYKWMNPIYDYRDDYFLLPSYAAWSEKLCGGKATAKGIDFMVSKNVGKISGHIGYSLLWSDRIFKDKNHGRKFPARFDNRHKINIMLCWKINDKWDMNCAWTGMSGNMFTLYSQEYEMLVTPDMPIFNGQSYIGILEYSEGLNNYRLPFYHRLDVAFNRHTKHGMWTFSLYNMYSYINTISISKDRWWFGTNDWKWDERDSFSKKGVFPIIPSVTYTWYFNIK